MIWQIHETASNIFSFYTINSFPAQTVQNRKKFENALFHDFQRKFCHEEKISFYFKDL